MTDDERTRFAHGLVEVIAGLGLSLGTAFRIVGMILDEHERDTIPIVGKLHVTRGPKGAEPAIWVER